MNKQLQEFARKTLLEGLASLPEPWVRTFKRMYGRNDGKRTLVQTDNMDISKIVAEISEEKLDWAMQQVSNSLEKLKEAPPCPK